MDATFSTAIVAARDARELSQEELAELLNVSRGYLAQWETSRQIPSEDKTRKLAAILDLDPDELLRLRAVAKRRIDQALRPGGSRVGDHRPTPPPDRWPPALLELFNKPALWEGFGADDILAVSRAHFREGDIMTVEEAAGIVRFCKANALIGNTTGECNESGDRHGP